MKKTTKEHYPAEDNLPIKNVNTEEKAQQPVVITVDTHYATIGALVKMSASCGGFQRIPLHLLSIPDYQRGEKNKVNQIAKEWDELQCDPLTVSYRDGELWIVDGLQRKLAAERVRAGDLMCRIHTGLTKRDEVRIYKNQNKNRAPMVTYDDIIADASLGDDPGTSILRICEESGVVLSKARNAHIGECGCVAAVVNAYAKIGEPGLKWVFKMVDVLGWKYARKGYAKIIISALATMFKEYTDHDAVATILATNCNKKIPSKIISDAKNIYGDRDKNAVLSYFQDCCKKVF